MDEDIIKHPGLILKEEIKALGLSISQVARRTGAKYPSILDLCNGYFRLAPYMALCLERGFPGRTAAEWLDLQAQFDHAKAVYKLEQIRERGKASKEILLVVPKPEG